LCCEKPGSHPLREAVEICELGVECASRDVAIAIPPETRRRRAEPETESLLEFALSDYERPRR
jgi:hypothetical protein